MTTNLLLLVITLLLAETAYAELTPTANLTLETAHYTCLLGSGIEMNAVKGSLNGNYSDNKQLGQYFQCMFRMYSLLDAQGNLKNETIFDAIHLLEKDHSYTEEGVSICQNDTLYRNFTQNDIAYEFFKCFKNNTEFAYYWSILKYLLNKQSAYSALTPTQSLKLETVHYTCAMGNDVQIQSIKNSLNGIYVSDDNKLVQYFQCVFRMYGYIDKDGQLKNETMLASIPTDDKDKLCTEDAIKSCQHVWTPTSNAIAYEFFKCFRNETDSAEYWTTLKELSGKNDKQDVSNVLVDFLL